MHRLRSATVLTIAMTLLVSMPLAGTQAAFAEPAAGATDVSTSSVSPQESDIPDDEPGVDVSLQSVSPEEWDIPDDDVPGEEDDVDPITGLTEEEQELTDAAKQEIAADCQQLLRDGRVNDYAICLDVLQKYEPRKHQSIVIDPLPDARVGQSVDVVAKATSGLPVSLEATGVCSLDGTRLVSSGAGLCMVWATQPGDPFWFPAAAVSDLMRFDAVAADLQVHLDGVAENAGRVYTRPSAPVRARITLAGVSGFAAPSGHAVDVSLGDSPKQSVSLDGAGQATATLVAPAELGDVVLSISYPGSAGIRPGTWSRTVTIQDMSLVDLVTDPVDGRIFDGDEVSITALVSPGDARDALVTFDWGDHDPVRVVPTKVGGQWQARLTTNDFTEGTHLITAKYTGIDDLAKPFVARSVVTIVVSDVKDASFLATKNPVKATAFASKSLTKSLPAPEARIYADTATALTMTIPGLADNSEVKALVQEGRGYQTLGRVRSNGPSVTFGVQSRTLGTYLLRVSAKDSGPYYLKVRVTKAPRKTETPAWDHTEMFIGFGAEVAKELIKGAFKAIGADALGSGVGWLAAKAIGLTTQKETKPDDKLRLELETQLSVTNDMLREVAADGKKLSQDMSNMSCGIQLGFANSAFAKIDSLDEERLSLQRVYTGKRDPGELSVGADWLAWANKVVDGDRDARTLVKEIDGAFMGRGDDASSALKKCAQSYRDDWRAAAAKGMVGADLGERDYYERVFRLRNLVQDYQARAFNLYVEAANLKALDAWSKATPKSGVTKPELGLDEIDDLCSMDLSGYDATSVAVACDKTRSMASEMYDVFARQFIAAGIGYSVNPVFQGRASTAASSPDLLWPTDANLLEEEPGASLVGNVQEIVMPTSLDQAYPTGWRVATASDWRPMLAESADGPATVAGIMAQHGFFKHTPPDKRQFIIYTSDRIPVSSVPGWAPPPPATDKVSTAREFTFRFRDRVWMSWSDFFKTRTWTADPRTVALCFVDTSGTTGATGLANGKTMPFCGPGESALPLSPDTTAKIQHADITKLIVRESATWIKDVFSPGKFNWFTENDPKPRMVRYVSGAHFGTTDPGFYDVETTWRLQHEQRQNGLLQGPISPWGAIKPSEWVAWDGVYAVGKYAWVEEDSTPGFIHNPSPRTWWRTGDYTRSKSATQALRWPVLDLTTIECPADVTLGSTGADGTTGGGSTRTYSLPTPGTNVAGVRAMCGFDLAGLLAQALGAPPMRVG